MPISTTRYASKSAPAQVVFAPVQPLTAFDETLGRLESAIKLGLLAPGARLPAERDLCTQLGISRSTLRQALTTLTASGHLHAMRGRGGGTFVVDRPPPAPAPDAATLTAWRDVCDERLGIELGVTMLAATRATEQSLKQIERLAAKLQSTTDFAHYCQLDRQFHIAIAELTQSPRLTIDATRVQSSIYDLLRAVGDQSGAIERSEEDHQALLTALSHNDSASALRAMCSHLDHTVELLELNLARYEVAG